MHMAGLSTMVRTLLCLGGLLTAVTACVHDSSSGSIPLSVAEEYRSIGGMDHVLTDVGSVFAYDSLVFVTDPANNWLIVLDEKAEMVRRIGREGSGPGEFRVMGPLGLLGDSLYIVDPALRRITYLSLEGSFRTMDHFDLPSSTEGYMPGPPAAILEDGRLLVPWVAMMGYGSAGNVDAVPVVAVRPRTGSTDTLAVLSQRNMQLVLEASGRPFFSRQPFADHSLFAALPGGAGIVVVDRLAAIRARNGSFRIFRIAANGDTTLAVTHVYDPIALPTTIVDSAAQRLWREFGGQTAPFTVQEVKKALYRPRYYPPVSSVVAGRDGSIWLRMEPSHNDTATWLVLDSKGDARARILIPAGVKLHDVGPNGFWGSRYDEFDVPHVIRFITVPQTSSAQSGAH